MFIYETVTIFFLGWGSFVLISELKALRFSLTRYSLLRQSKEMDYVRQVFSDERSYLVNY
jgi:hypothetical protein